MASIDINTIIGITIAISLAVFFPSGVLVATCIYCEWKMRSKVPIHHSALNKVIELIGTDQKTTMANEVETSSAFGSAKKRETE